MDNYVGIILASYIYIYMNKRMREAELKSQKAKSIFTQILKEIKQWTGNPYKWILIPAVSLTSCITSGNQTTVYSFL